MDLSQVDVDQRVDIVAWGRVSVVFRIPVNHRPISWWSPKKPKENRRLQESTMLALLAALRTGCRGGDKCQLLSESSLPSVEGVSIGCVGARQRRKMACACASQYSRGMGEPLGPEGHSDAQPAAAPTVMGRSSTDVIDAALRLVTALADATLNNADGVSVTLERHGRLMTVAASNDAVLTMDHHQYDTGEGPCLDAKAEGRWFYIESLDNESRWPRFVPLALQQGIHSILSSPLKTNQRTQGALNIYSSKDRAFDTRDQELAALFADQASEILTTAGSEVTDEQSKERFTEALTSRRVIHQAQGSIMATDGLSAEAASASLYRAARQAGVTVLEYATRVLATIGRDRGED